jgi:glycerol kinase
MPDAVLVAIDQGTSSTRSIAFSERGEALFLEQQTFAQIYPDSGWVEHDAEVIWTTTLCTARKVLEQLETGELHATAIGLTNQRETTILWDRRTGVPIHNAIVWQDRRTAGRCSELAAQGLEPELIEKTGLRLDPYFSATKIGWILDAVPGARAAARAGHIAFGTVDSFLIWRLTGGKAHLTDATNASRTALFDIRKGVWDQSLCDAFGVPMPCLPEVRDSAGFFAETEKSILGAALPISGVAGDQQAALIGQACFNVGDVKSTFGTGAFLVLNTGTKLVRSKNALLSTVAYRINGSMTYALEGSILSAGSTIQWLRDGLGLFSSSADVEALALSVSDSGGVYIAPAFTGLGAPYWDPDARGAILGLTRSSGRGEIARAGIDSAVYQTRDLLDAMAADGVRPIALKIDGGMAGNGFFMQRLADILNLPIIRPKIVETTAFGAACLAGLGCGLFASLNDIASLWQSDQRCEPGLDPEKREQDVRGWRTALGRIKTR